MQDFSDLEKDLENYFDTNMLKIIAYELIKVKLYKEAKKYYDRAMKLSPEDPNLIRMAAINLKNMRMYDDALDLLKKCLPFSNEKRHIWMEMAYIYEMIGNEICQKTGLISNFHPKWIKTITFYEKAIRCMEKASEEKPTSWGILQELERFHAFIGNYEMAIEYREKARAIDRKNWYLK